MRRRSRPKTPSQSSAVWISVWTPQRASENQHTQPASEKLSRKLEKKLSEENPLDQSDRDIQDIYITHNVFLLLLLLFQSQSEFDRKEKLIPRITCFSSDNKIIYTN